MADPVEEAIRELTYLTMCRCKPPYPLSSGRRDPDCLEHYYGDVREVAAEVERLRAENTELRRLLADAVSGDKWRVVFDNKTGRILDLEPLEPADEARLRELLEVPDA